MNEKRIPFAYINCFVILWSLGVAIIWFGVFPISVPFKYETPFSRCVRMRFVLFYTSRALCDDAAAAAVLVSPLHFVHHIIELRSRIIVEYSNTYAAICIDTR